MLLAVDIGNSNITFGVFRGRDLLYDWRMETRSGRTQDEYASFLFPLVARHKIAIAEFQGIVLVSVVPQVEWEVARFCKEYLHQEPFCIHYQCDLGFDLSVDFPREVGADRLANAAYAIAFASLPAIVVDLGTATTFDVLSGRRAYEGGAILPGIRLALESLGSKTAKLPVVELKPPKNIIGRNTVDCIRSGVLWGYVDLIEGLLCRMERVLEGPATVLLTGGFAPMVGSYLKRAVEIVPDLTLQGARILFIRNSKTEDLPNT